MWQVAEYIGFDDPSGDMRAPSRIVSARPPVLPHKSVAASSSSKVCFDRGATVVGTASLRVRGLKVWTILNPEQGAFIQVDDEIVSLISDHADVRRVDAVLRNHTEVPVDLVSLVRHGLACVDTFSIEDFDERETYRLEIDPVTEVLTVDGNSVWRNSLSGRMIQLDEDSSKRMLDSFPICIRVSEMSQSLTSLLGAGFIRSVSYESL